MNKILLMVFSGFVLLGFTPTESTVNVYFKEVNFTSDTTIHFANLVFIPGKNDTIETIAIDRFLHPKMKSNGAGSRANERYLSGNCRGSWNDDQIYIVDFGFIYEDTTMCDQHTQLYKIKKGQPVPELELAYTYCSPDVKVFRDSWFVDIDKDGKTDILTREVTETLRLTDTTEEFYYHIDDTLYAWQNVSHVLKEFYPKNQDSLKSVFQITERKY
jgi:hypothetical protein